MLKSLGHRDFTEERTASLLKKVDEHGEDSMTFDTYIKLFADFDLGEGNKELKGSIKQVANKLSAGYH